MQNEKGGQSASKVISDTYRQEGVGPHQINLISLVDARLLQRTIVTADRSASLWCDVSKIDRALIIEGCSQLTKSPRRSCKTAGSLSRLKASTLDALLEGKSSSRNLKPRLKSITDSL